MTVTFGMPQPAPYREQWTPVRYVARDQVCHLCWGRIPRASPGTSSGTRGTKAFFESKLRLWECVACHAERTRAELSTEQEATQGGST